MTTQSTCNICNGNDFTEGPLGRLSLSGKKPTCTSCGSLERHRILRTAWSLISINHLRKKKALQFSSDPSVDKTWFRELEISTYGYKNSIDIQNIDRKDAHYDIVICNQILEHVADDKTAFAELMRILKPNGFLQMTVPNPIMRQTTEDWGYPKEDFHGHYRHYGLDLIEYFQAVTPSIYMICVKASDEITGTQDYVFFWTQNQETKEYLIDCFSGHLEIAHSI
ncbi:MAG: Unknown protein [uncultured Thiotrichaceae bacterium]|uniref:Methyltransferase type 11 domain-containing protein n=1 Tax=uncultured Thiotrichaceae bacterium TaxID=298394 RepID=A0A6S6SGP3_9GAMM|nr:MAG: Unknown protein [uncultured Thiotrichaceae bacterium]